MTEKQIQKLNDGREYRNMVLEIRKMDEEEPADGGQMIVEGYATTFDEPYTLFQDKEFRVDEIVDRHAFDDTDLSDVIFQYNHEGRVFARMSNGSMKLEADDHGLKVTADLSGTTIGRNLYEEIKGGYTNKMSFGFVVGEDREARQTVDGIEVYTRIITKISKLFDVSAVSIPANNMTEISSRSLVNGAIDTMRTERSEREKKLKLLNLLLEV